MAALGFSTAAASLLLITAQRLGADLSKIDRTIGKEPAYQSKKRRASGSYRMETASTAIATATAISRKPASASS